MKMVKVKVKRSFYFNREPQPANAIIELPELFARECVSAKKVEMVEDASAATVKTADPAAGSKDGQGKGEKK